MFIDSHCHFFTKSLMSSTTVSFVKSVMKRDTSRLLAKSMKKKELELIFDFLDVGLNSTSEKVYQQMVKAYGEDFIAVPKMLDLSFASSEEYKPNEADEVATLNTNKRFLIKAVNYKKGPNTKSSKKVTSFLSHLNTAPLAPRVFANSLQSQIEELIEVKKAYPSRVYPFLSVDVRQESHIIGGILALIKKYVGPDKPFLGLKVYPSVGYSPTHPLLYSKDDNETVFSWCEKNHIPVTTHLGEEGFSHILNTTAIEGDIYYPEAGEVVPIRDLYEDGIVHYKTKVPTTNYEEFIKERSLVLNHPKVWRKVLERYPKLKINFAHCGGSKHLQLYSSGSSLGYLTRECLELINDYKYAYTDLSCFTTKNSTPKPVSAFYNNVYKKLNKNQRDKVLYGSDYYMLLLTEKDLFKYLNKFKKSFKNDFENIALKNPMDFLNIKKLP